MKKERIIDFTKIRIYYLFRNCIIISALISLLCVMGILPNGSRDIIIGVNVGAVLFIGLNFYHMRADFLKLADKKMYYISNLCAYAIFAAVNLLLCLSLPSALYTWFFAITKILRFSKFGLTSFQSALVFHGVMLCTVYFSTVGLGWVFVKKAERKAKKAALPPKLTINPLENKPQKTEVEYGTGTINKKIMPQVQDGAGKLQD